jgi:hypothetical protein
VGPRAGLDAVARRINHSPFWELNPGRPARSFIFTILSTVGVCCVNKVISSQNVATASLWM